MLELSGLEAPRRIRRRALLLETVATIALCLGSGQAFAACTGFGTDTVTCAPPSPISGDVTIMPLPANVTVNILANVQINGTLIVTDNGSVDMESVTVNNDGMINGSPTGVDITVVGPGDSTFNNNGQINGAVVINNNAAASDTFTFHQNGNMSSSLTMTGTGSNSLIIHAGRSVQATEMVGANNYLDNSGITNSTLEMTGTVSNYVINRAGAQINADLLTAPTNTVENYGSFNAGITFDDVSALVPNIANTVINYEGATIAGGIHSEAAAEDHVENSGMINGNVELGDGDDIFVNYPGAETNTDAVATNGVDLGAGDDQFWMGGGTINGDIAFGDGDDLGIMTDGTLTNRVLGGSGSDQLTWAGGIIQNGVDMGADDDRVFLTSLPASSIMGSMNYVPVNGGTGNDVLRFWNTTADNVGRFDEWERIDLTFRSQLIFSGAGNATLVLGDAGTGTGTLFIDATSSVLAGAGNHAVDSFGGADVIVQNAGTIDLTNGSNDDAFTIFGDYVGLNGALNLQTYLDDDGNTDNGPSDRLVISGGDASATGATRIYVQNTGGLGGVTVGDGIRVVDAQGGATTNAGSFMLGAPVGAGVFEYLLFQGGLGPDAATDNDWFLRSHVEGANPPPVDPPDPPEPPDPPPPVDPGPVDPPVLPETPDPPGPGEPGEPPDPPDPPLPPPVIPGPAPLPTCATDPVLCPVAPPIPPTIDPDTPLIRPEIPSYVIVPGMAQQMGLASLATFHERRGDQFLVADPLQRREGWGRFFGEQRDRAWDSVITSLNYDLAPRFDGQIIGLQAGRDLWGREYADGSLDRVGLFFTHTEVDGNVSGHVLAHEDVDKGRLDMDGESLGISWTHIAAEGWYVDGIGMATWIHGDAGSDRGIGADLSGFGLMASLEAGYPIALGRGWTLEPQVQVIWQNISLGDTDDRFSDIGYDTLSGFTGRVGARLEGNGDIAGTRVQYFVSADYWYDSETDNDVVFYDRSVTTGVGGSALEMRVGASSHVTERLSLYGSLGYTEDLTNEDSRAFGGNLGLRYRW